MRWRLMMMVIMINFITKQGKLKRKQKAHTHTRKQTKRTNAQDREQRKSDMGEAVVYVVCMFSLMDARMGWVF